MMMVLGEIRGSIEEESSDMVIYKLSEIEM